MTVTSSVEAARAGFRTAFGREPAGVWSAPGRVNLIGEHTDYNEGFVLPFAIDRRTYVALAAREDRTARVASAGDFDDREIDLGGITAATMSGWSAYPFGTAWGLGRVGADLDRVGGFDAYFTSDVPLGAGLSSSAALECSLAVALDETWRLDLGRDRLVRATNLAENQIVGAPTGILDQSASLLAAPDAVLFLDCRDGTHELVALGLEEEGLTVLVIDTRVTHAHADGGYASRREACERGARTLGVRALRDLEADDLARAQQLLDEETFRRVRHIVTENRRVLETVATLRRRGPRAIGELLLASHASMRDDFEISVPELDRAVESAMAAGAVGARMTGGGFGGSAIALVERAGVDAVTEQVLAAFARAGHEEPEIFAVQPSAGARREQE
ncbi:galactokinase [Nocardioides sp.]|jgi:galactokinase|uniref:galactokinase n=1 Tax=Nocardioides sp. TaxID=35761 RepID=UPI002BD3E9D1|nr:galactokinase [Nocardioides sp.]HVX55902.1 galactokinase [Nocardioides sp.]